jgi:hypothetical protein
MRGEYSTAIQIHGIRIVHTGLHGLMVRYGFPNVSPALWKN